MFLRSDRKNKPVPIYAYHIYWCSCFYECSLFFHVNFGYCVLPHNFNLKNSFSVSCRAVISMKISLNFFYLGMSIFSHFLKDSFAGYRILGWQPFSFITLSMSSKYLLTPVVFDVKLAVVLLRIPCTWWIDSLGLLSRFLFIFGFEILIMMSLCVDLFYSNLLQVN